MELNCNYTLDLDRYQGTDGIPKDISSSDIYFKTRNPRTREHYCGMHLIVLERVVALYQSMILWMNQIQLLDRILFLLFLLNRKYFMAMEY